ncbi:MAG: hypothetical protein LC808_22365, partial [Actinobacteria bacterium]|nr:hypothetical protein [Actinomycetota bacterium]
PNPGRRVAGEAKRLPSYGITECLRCAWGPRWWSASGGRSPSVGAVRAVSSQSHGSVVLVVRDSLFAVCELVVTVRDLTSSVVTVDDGGGTTGP